MEGSMVDIISDQLDEAKDTKSVKAIILRINHLVELLALPRKFIMQLFDLKMKQKNQNSIYFDVSIGRILDCTGWDYIFHCQAVL